MGDGEVEGAVSGWGCGVSGGVGGWRVSLEGGKGVYYWWFIDGYFVHVLGICMIPPLYFVLQTEKRTAASPIL